MKIKAILFLLCGTLFFSSQSFACGGPGGGLSDCYNFRATPGNSVSISDTVKIVLEDTRTVMQDSIRVFYDSVSGLVRQFGRLIIFIYFLYLAFGYMLNNLRPIHKIAQDIIIVMFAFPIATHWDVFALYIFNIYKSLPEGIASSISIATGGFGGSLAEVIAEPFQKSHSAITQIWDKLDFPSDFGLFLAAIFAVVIPSYALLIILGAMYLVAFAGATVLFGFFPFIVMLAMYPPTRSMIIAFFTQIINFMFQGIAVVMIAFISSEVVRQSMLSFTGKGINSNTIATLGIAIWLMVVIAGLSSIIISAIVGGVGAHGAAIGSDLGRRITNKLRGFNTVVNRSIGRASRPITEKNAARKMNRIEGYRELDKSNISPKTANQKVDRSTVTK